MPAVLARRALAEFTGTAFLVAAVVGSGIAATRLSPNEVGLELLENSVVTGAVLVALILTLQPVSAAFNPVVTLVERALDAVTTRQAGVLIVAQIGGGFAGAVVANLMFGLPAVTISAHHRAGAGIWLGEVVATLGLLVVIFGTVRSGRADRVAYAVGLYILAAYWFTSSTSFANPAVTIARMFSDTFAGIAPGSAVMFVVMQLAGGVLGYALIRLLYPNAAAVAARMAGRSDPARSVPAVPGAAGPGAAGPGAAGPGAAVPGAAGPGAAGSGAAGPVAGIPASDGSVTGGPGMTVRDEADVVRTDVHSR
ncbi:MAG TPA: aquaporin [Streptosporangiaceae bacterium]|nr:aquaporin [Streptosporangiaceae bacterium]